jgi:RNA polymerase sigma factor (sigma-70 family)
MEKRVAVLRPRRYMVAVVLGATLGAVAPSQATAAPAPEASSKAVGDMGRYCSVCWRNARLPEADWSDCTQQVFARLLERVPTDAWDRVLGDEGLERREFLRAIDAVKKRAQRARKTGHNLDGLADRAELRRRDLDEQLAQVTEAAVELLTPRQQRILQMSFEGWSVADMAAELNLPAERVSDEKYKAVRKLRAHLVGSEADGVAASRLTA